MKNGEVQGAKNSGNFNFEENGEDFLVLPAEILPEKWKCGIQKFLCFHELSIWDGQGPYEILSSCLEIRSFTRQNRAGKNDTLTEHNFKLN